ncbi:hypothetical protein AGMMS49992_27760 [Clostridia bacterium]|nr:hypothetical protein AGMMS49992_27760 [Clostridia bacterium]
MALFKKKPVIEEQPKELEDKTPAFLCPLYPYKAVGEYLDCSRLEDDSYIEMNGVLYELHCLNPECVLNVRTQGVNLRRMYNKLLEVGCPSCKQKEPFVVRRVVYVPEEVTTGRMGAFEGTESEQARQVAEAFYVSGEYLDVEKEHLRITKEKHERDAEAFKKKWAEDKARIDAMEAKKGNKQPQ